jgi:hypothetical protein
VFLAAALGCGKNTAHVSGQVTYQGKAVPSGSVTFYGDNGQTDSAMTDSEGKYTLAQAPVGTVKVSVVPAQPRTTRQPKKDSPASRTVEHPGKGQAPPTSGPPMKIPHKYHTAEASGLTYTVARGKQTINIPLD